MQFSYFETEKALQLSDSDYYYYLIEKIRNAKKRIFVTIFFVNINPDSDKDRLVRDLIDELVYAKWKGVDVRMIIGHSEKSFQIDVEDKIVFQYLKNNSVPVKFYNSEKNYSLHSKYIVIDDKLVITGSHNWTPYAFFESKEDSIAVHSNDIAIKFTREFHEIWKSGKEEMS